LAFLGRRGRAPCDPLVLALRFGFTALVMALVTWLLLAGRPLGAVAVVIIAVSLRRAAEHGRFARVTERATARR
jgi:hypothetical protein